MLLQGKLVFFLNIKVYFLKQTLNLDMVRIYQLMGDFP